jgi:hypothetical protein
MNDSNNKRSVWSYILPYFFTVLFVVLIVAVIIRQFFSGSTKTFKESELDTVLRTDVDDLNTIASAYSPDEYYIRNVSVKTNISTTTVTGEAYCHDTNHTQVSFQVILPASHWTTSAPHNKDKPIAIVGSDGKTLDAHASWSEVFLARVDDWKGLSWVSARNDSRISPLPPSITPIRIPPVGGIRGDQPSSN